MSELHQAGASVTGCVIKYYITWGMMKGVTQQLPLYA